MTISVLTLANSIEIKMGSRKVIDSQISASTMKFTIKEDSLVPRA